VSIPSCTGELGGGEEPSLAEVRSGLKSWGLGVSLEELGTGEERIVAEARTPRSVAWRGVTLSRGKTRTGAVKSLTACALQIVLSSWPAYGGETCIMRSG
jgi:hypothetical protein